MIKNNELTGFDLIQQIYPGQAQLKTEQVGRLINETDEYIRFRVRNNKFEIAHFKKSKSRNAKLFFDVRDVASYIDALRNQVKRGRKTKAEKIGGV